MTPTINEFLRWHFGRILLFGGVGASAVVAGTTGSLPTRALITNSIGLLSLVPSAQAAEASPSITAPAWELKDVDGKTVKSSDFAGRRARLLGDVVSALQSGNSRLRRVAEAIGRQGPRHCGRLAR